MMYIHYCQTCNRIHILNGHKSVCPSCAFRLTELKISYMEYIELGSEERNQLQNRLKLPNNLTILKS